MKKETLLLTGGDQMLAKHFVALYGKRYHIKLLTPMPTQEGEYYWNPSREELDPKALEGVDHILHLPIPSYDPLIQTVQLRSELRFAYSGVLTLISRYLMEMRVKLKSLILASSVEYYGNRYTPYIYHEASHSGEDFLAREYQAMEEEGNLLKIENLVDRLVVARFGYVFSHYDGILPHLAVGSTCGLALYFGNGRQLLPWVHASDACKMICWSLEGDVEGVFNVTAPEWCSSYKIAWKAAMMRTDMALQCPLPAGFLRLLRGEFAESFLSGMRVTSRKLQEEGFVFNYPTLEEAFVSIYDL